VIADRLEDRIVVHGHPFRGMNFVEKSTSDAV